MLQSLYSFSWPIDDTTGKITVRSNNVQSIQLHLLPLKSIELSTSSHNEEYILEYDQSKWSNLHELLLYSPRVIDTYEKMLYILYQLLKIARLLHAANLNLSELKLNHIYIDDNYWVRIKPPIDSMLRLYRLDEGEEEEEDEQDCNGDDEDNDDDDDDQRLESQVMRGVSCPREIKQRLASVYDSYRHLNHRDLAQVTKSWCASKITNFDYLLILNCIAGIIRIF